MASESSQASARELRINEIIAGHLQALDAGQVPDRQALLRQHPDLAADLEAGSVKRGVRRSDGFLEAWE